MSSLIIIDIYFLFQQQRSARGVSRNEEEGRKLSQSLRLFFSFLNQYTFHAFAYPAYFDLPFILVLILSVSFSIAFNS